MTGSDSCGDSFSGKRTNRSDQMGNALELQEADKLPVAGSTDRRQILPLAKGSCAPLSFAQQQIWLHAQLIPDLPLYNEPVTVNRRGPLDETALNRALTEIVRRHQAWRTTFTLVDGEPVQVVQPPPEIRVSVADLSRVPEGQHEAEAQRLAVADACRPFNLSQGPLFRALLARLSDNEHRLFLTLHHIIFDGYSIYRVFLPELATLYDAFVRGQESPLPDLATQYSDFAAWEREWLSSEDHASSQLSYWRERLSGNLPVLQLPSDHPRPAVQSFRGAIQPLAFSSRLSDALKRLSQQESATLFMCLAAAFTLLLQRYSSSDDVVIGTVSSRRKRSELEGLLGYFLNPLVLRNDLSGDPTFRGLLRRTREVALGALSNDDVPFTQVVHEVHPSRSLSFNPLFQVMLTLEPPVPANQDGWTVALTQSEVDTGISKFDLCLELDDQPSGMVGRFKYSCDLFQPEAISRMAGHLSTLLESIAANPDLPISQLQILTERERRQLCIEWNDTDAEFPSDSCLHQRVADQVERTPETVALVDDDRQWTYRELECRSNQLAAYLQKCGVAPEAAVGLYLEPCGEMVIGILGVLKAGGACLPLDPTYPSERLEHVLADAQPRVLLTQQRLLSQLPPSGLKTVCLDSEWNAIAQSDQPVPDQCTPENLAYVIYTSGSTGKPKGVQITHRNLVHSTHARSIYYGTDAGRFLLLSSFAFDSSLAGIFGTLCQGGTLVLTPGSLQSNLSQLAQLVEQHRISELLAVPSLYSLLLEQSGPSQLASLRTVIVAGESCPRELVDRHFATLPHTALFNEYGPTEASVWSTVHRFQPGSSGKVVSIGRPIPNAQVYVLDPHRNPVPIGIPGELYIGGPGVVRGYLNRSTETAERFIPDPINAKPGHRLYKTGDRVRYLADGNLELLGRLDHQVKIRGFRLELEEIEAVISEYEGVQQALVTIRNESNGEPKLMASIVPADVAAFQTDQLHSFLSKKLPEVMLPSSYTLLEKLPLLPNGKVDRQAVAGLVQPASGTQFSKPHSVIELTLVQIWQEVLDRPGIGVTENFFDLGGHSLLVAKLLLRIEQRFGKRLSLANVFQAPTIRELALLLNGNGQSIHCGAVVPIQPRGSRPPLFLVRGGPLFLPLANRLGLDQPLLGLDLPASDASQLPVPYKLEDIAAVLVSRMREVQPTGPYYLAGLCVNGVIAYEMASQLVQQGESVGLLVLFDAQNPTFYEDFSQESRSQLLLRRIGYQLASLRRQKLPGFLRERLIGIHRRLSVRYWRIHYALGLPVDEEQLRDLDTIVHPASFVYRPGPYPDAAVFFQSTDWPVGRYWDFHSSWNGLIQGGLKVFKIPGGHESMFYEENVDLVAGKLQDCLSEAMRGRNGSGGSQEDVA